VFFLQGHWIVPSLQDGPAKLEAVAKAITAHKQRRESYWAAAATQTQQLKTDDDYSGKKTGFLGHLYLKMMILPRQARDKHRENSKKSPFCRSRRRRWWWWQAAVGYS
jgi:hypothetical protein